MKEENMQRIIEACPQIFHRDTFYFECGDGWTDLLFGVSRFVSWKMQAHPTDLWEEFKVTQIKEKFGTLRYYVEGCPDTPAGHEVAGAIAFAEMLSGIICEVCGSPGQLRGGGWLVTLCASCLEPKS